MKNILINSSLVLASLFMGVSEAKEKSYSLSLSSPTEPATLEVEVNVGSVNVVGYEGKTVEIIANVSPIKESHMNKQQKKMRVKMKQKMDQHRTTKSRSSEGLKPVKSPMLHLEIEEEDNVVEISSESMQQHVDLMIKVPSKSKVSIEVFHGGNINVDNISGELELESFQGGVTAKNVSGPIVAETYTQDIVVEFSKLNQSTPTSLTSHAGNVDITLAKNIKANVNVQTYQGEIFSGLSSDFVAMDDVVKKGQGDKQKITIGGTLQAKLNGGGQELSLITYIGNLYIRQEK